MNKFNEMIRSIEAEKEAAIKAASEKEAAKWNSKMNIIKNFLDNINPDDSNVFIDDNKHTITVWIDETSDLYKAFDYFGSEKPCGYSIHQKALEELKRTGYCLKDFEAKNWHDPYVDIRW